MPNAKLQWIEECGHVPHLEQPEKTADAIVSFLTTEVDIGTGANGSAENQPPYLIGAGFLGIGGAVAIANLFAQ